MRGARPVPQDGLFGFECLAAITAETGRCLRKVEEVREHVQREMGGPEVQQKLSGHRILSRRPALGERVHRRLDAPQTSDVGECTGNGAALGSVERSWSSSTRFPPWHWSRAPISSAGNSAYWAGLESNNADAA